MRIIVLPDIHGRHFWENCVEEMENCDRVIFLGDYLDPYGFEEISVESAISNFKNILDLSKRYGDKVVLLLGNHDMPYFSEEYLSLSNYHCRWSREWHDDISSMFDAHRHLFKIAHVEDGVLFTHAGCTTWWLDDLYSKFGTCDTILDLEKMLNGLLGSMEGIKLLRMVSRYRGGKSVSGSCIWAHVNEMVGDGEEIHFSDCQSVRQVFGHTLQLGYDENGLACGDPIETPTAKMLDTRNGYILDTATFVATPIF